MPANLTPDYLKAEQWYRQATTNEEKILATERMLAVIPKHKGTDHLKADLRRRLSKLRETAVQKKHGGQVDIFHVPKGGAGQIVLLGMPNCGKSAIVAALTNAKTTVAEFPFATSAPVPGMMQFEDVPIQLVDMPPITADYVMPGQVGTYRHCEVIGIVIDLSGDVAEQMRVCLDFLESRNLLLSSEAAGFEQSGNVTGRKAVCICTKCDICQPGASSKVKKLCQERFECIEVSPQTAQGLEELAGRLFRLLGIIRIYAKPPGKDADMSEPFTLPAGATVQDLAGTVHRQLAEKLKSARIWGTSVYDGQNVQLSHILNDKDIVELHFG